MERSVEHYQNDRFEILAEVNNEDTFHNFIGTQLKKRSVSRNFYLAFLFISTWFLISIFISKFSKSTPIELFFYQFGFGIFLGLFLIPLHELLHGLYLKFLGCFSIGFEWDLFKFRFSCYSDNFVMSLKEYHLFLLIPFTTISFLLIILASYFTQFQVLFLSMLLFHSTICAGDFALVNYSSDINKDNLFIYYDITMKKTVFLTDK
jgi:hypothetical protein